MCKLSLCALFALIASLPTSGHACDFDLVLDGSCPAEIVEDELLKTEPLDRAVLASKYKWSNFDEFKNFGRDEVLVINVCLFRGPAKTIFDTTVEPVDFTSRDDVFDEVAGQIEVAASPWEAVAGKTGSGQRAVSRVDFRFRDGTGAFRDCETDREAHISIVANTRGGNFSAIGFEGFDKAGLRSDKPRATMAILLTEGAISDSKALHEFGHALGLLHEMAHDTWQICVDYFLPEEYIKDFSFGYPTQEENLAAAKRNVRALPDRFRNFALPQSEAFDRFGIMSYQIPAKYFRADVPEGCIIANDATELSTEDKRFFLGQYGRRD